MHSSAPPTSDAPAASPAPGPVRSPLRSLDEVRADLLSRVSALSEVESVSLFDADGRVLAEDLTSPLQVPPQDNSAMDGYAVRVADLAAASGTELPISQRIPAGAVAQPLQAGTVARIFTGASIPAGADAVLMQEDAQAGSDGHVKFTTTPRAGQHIRRAGEDVQRGAVVLACGRRLNSAAQGMAASIGRATVSVTRRPRVALFSTGDELVMPGSIAPEQMPPGAIYNSNRFFLRSLLQRLGCEVTDLGVVPDRRDATVAALRDAARANDLILTSGGVSVGEEDHVKPAVQALGTLDLWQLAIKPGKPFAYGRVRRGDANANAVTSANAGEAHFIGLPGNPVSSFVTFLLLVRPFVLKLQGATQLDWPSMPARADFAWPKADKRREFLRVRRNAHGGLDLFANQSSGVLTSMVWGDGLVDNPPGTVIAPGDTVRFVPFAELMD